MLFDKKGYDCGCDYEPMMQQPAMQQPGMGIRQPMMQCPMMQRPMMPQAYDDDMCGCPGDPIIEAPIEKCIKRDICHEVRHICPIHTKVINNHIYRHTYDPAYSCSEENVITNLDQGSCCNFR